MVKYDSLIASGQAAPPRRAKIGVVTVTYNSSRFFNMYMTSLESQTLKPDLVVLVDSGSASTEFLDRVTNFSLAVEILRETNVGFCVGSNIGWRRVRDLDFVLFLNPDAFLTPDFIEKALSYLEAHPEVGMVTPSLVRYDIEKMMPLDAIDTTGVVRDWYGFRERDQSKPVDVLMRYKEPNYIPWLCAAVAIGRREAMDMVVEPGDQLFDESFFMYKDDTDLSWRVRRAGWYIVHHPGLLGYHCRGWQNRRKMSRKARLLSVRNEFKMCWKNHSPFAIVTAIKYLLVRGLDI